MAWAFCSRIRLASSGADSFAGLEMGGLVEPAGEGRVVPHFAGMAGEMDKDVLRDLFRPMGVPAQLAQGGMIDEVYMASDQLGEGWPPSVPWCSGAAVGHHPSLLSPSNGRRSGNLDKESADKAIFTAQWAHRLDGRSSRGGRGGGMAPAGVGRKKQSVLPLPVLLNGEPSNPETPATDRPAGAHQREKGVCGAGARRV